MPGHVTRLRERRSVPGMCEKRHQDLDLCLLRRARLELLGRELTRARPGYSRAQPRAHGEVQHPVTLEVEDAMRLELGEHLT